MNYKLPDVIYKISRRLGMASKPLLWEFPIVVVVGLTNFCNFNCSFCLNGKIRKKRGFMEESLFRSLVDCVADKFQSKTSMALGLFGEAALHPNFTDFMKYASSRGVKIGVSTNFSGIDKEISEALIPVLNIIEISFYTLDKEKYSQIVGKNTYDQVLKNIHSFLAMAERAGFKGEIRLRPFRDFVGQTDAYKKEFYQRYPGLNFSGQDVKTMSNWAGFLNLPELMRPYLRTPCSSPFGRLAVDWDGQVLACCNAMMAEDVTVGYVDANNDLYDLWHGKKLNEIREKFSKIDYRDFPSCQNCYFSRRYFPIRKD